MSASRAPCPRAASCPRCAVEKLYLDMIAAARHSIYIENQYFTAPRIAAALEKRLAEDDGPEIVLVLRLLNHGWLEEATMHVLHRTKRDPAPARCRSPRALPCAPHIRTGRGCCPEHPFKLMIVDDAIVRIGSSNLASRSMAFDSECDLAIEARGDGQVEDTIRAFRERLLAEHLGTEPARVTARRSKACRQPARRHRRFRGPGAHAAATGGRSGVFGHGAHLASVADPEPVALETLLSERHVEEKPVVERPS